MILFMKLKRFIIINLIMGIVLVNISSSALASNLNIENQNHHEKL